MVPHELAELLEPVLRRLDSIERKLVMADAGVAAVVSGFSGLSAEVAALVTAFQAAQAGTGVLDAADEAALVGVASSMTALAASITAILPTGVTGATGPAPAPAP